MIVLVTHCLTSGGTAMSPNEKFKLRLTISNSK